MRQRFFAALRMTGAVQYQIAPWLLGGSFFVVGN